MRRGNATYCAACATICERSAYGGRNVARGRREDRLELYPNRRGTTETFEFGPIKFAAWLYVTDGR